MVAPNCDLRAAPMPQNRMQPTMAEEITMLSAVSKAWENDAPGHVIRFHGSVLERTSNSVGRNPYLIVQVSKDLIPNHNDIYDPRVTTFLRSEGSHARSKKWPVETP